MIRLLLVVLLLGCACEKHRHGPYTYEDYQEAFGYVVISETQPAGDEHETQQPASRPQGQE